MKFNKHDNRSPAARAHQTNRKAEFFSVHKKIGTMNALYWSMRSLKWWTDAVLKARPRLSTLPIEIRTAAAQFLAEAEAQRGKR